MLEAFKGDAFLASPFRVEWMTDIPREVRDDCERGLAAKAASILRAARFAHLLHDRAATEIEIKVWIETGFDPAFVGLHWERRLARFSIHLFDASGRERLAAVIFDAIPCVTAAESEAETALFLGAALGALADAPGGLDHQALMASIDRLYE
ncbi:MAG TPA: hypothetical protein VM889_11435 [Candidatus Thermoplasmatota archaeon]|nr:hypothetical protein [Candidatus Thermoplasmatota archaeon]